MMTTWNVFGRIIPVVLGVCSLSVIASAQEIEWEHPYFQQDTVERSGTWYTGLHILPMEDGGYVITSLTNGGGTAAVARFDNEGKRLWERGITDYDTNIYGREFGSGDQVKLFPRFSYVREDGRIVFFGNEGGGDFALRNYGAAYSLVLNAETGEPLDTVTGFEAGRLWNAGPVCRMRDGRFAHVMTWEYSTDLDSLGALAMWKLTNEGRDLPGTFRLQSVGKREEGKEVWHYPSNIIQTSDGGFVVYGVRGGIRGGVSEPGTFFLLKVDSIGMKVWEEQTEPEQVGIPYGAFLDSTSDGGFIMLGTVIYRDSTQQRQRWSVMRLVKCTSEGKIEWSREYESARDYTQARRVRQTADGGFVLLGTVGGFNERYTVYQNLQEQGFLLKTDTEGKEQWCTEWGDSRREDLSDMLLLPDGSGIVTGNSGEAFQLYLAKIKIGTLGVGSTGEEASGTGTFQVIPNPARDRLRVVCRASVKGGAIRLYDILGRDVFGRSFPVGSSGSVELDISALPVGRYRVALEGAQQHVVAVRSVVIVR